MKKTLFTLFCFALMVGAYTFFTSSTPSPLVIELESAKKINASLLANPTEEISAKILLPNSLSEIDLSGNVYSFDNEQLTPTRALRDLFDTYLSAYGELDLANIIALIQQELIRSLTEPVRSQGFDLLKRYIDYKIALKERAHLLVIDSSLGSDQIQHLLDAQIAVRSIQSDFFNEQEIDAFFHLEDLHTQFLIEQIRINQDQTLSTIQKQQALQSALSVLPSKTIETRTQQQAFSDLRSDTQVLIKQGASEEAIYSLRAEKLGHTAAQALSELDKSRAQWTARINNFAIDRQQILTSTLSQVDKTSAINDLLNRQFNQLEKKRVMALMKDGQLEGK